MVTSNLQTFNTVGEASMSNGDFLTFDALANNKGMLMIPRLPDVQFFLQSFNLPDVTVNEIRLPTSTVDYLEVGEKLNFQPFGITFLVDKYCRNWASVYNWMKSITSRGSAIGEKSNIVLMIDGEETFRFNDAWVKSLSGMTFDTTVEDVTYVKANVQFNYDYFDYIGKFSTVDSTYK